MQWLNLEQAGFELNGFSYNGKRFFLAKVIDNTLADQYSNRLETNGFGYHKSLHGFYAPITIQSAQILMSLPGAKTYDTHIDSVFLKKGKNNDAEDRHSISVSRLDTGRPVRSDSVSVPERPVSEGTGTDVSDQGDHGSFEPDSGRSGESGHEAVGGASGTESAASGEKRQVSGTGDLAQPVVDDSQGGSDRRDGFDVGSVKKNPRHYFISDEITRVAGFRKKDRYEENVAAIKILNDLEIIDRDATDQEKQQLVRFNGWGGMPEVFDDYEAGKKPWSEKAYDELKGLLSEKEYHAALSSVNNSHYTNPVVVRQIWKALQRQGFSGGKILETSMGIGNFLGLAPKEIVENSEFFGIEKDDLPGRMAAKIYPDAQIKILGFEDTVLPDNYFDLAVSNVPFGDFSVFDDQYPQWSKHSIHDFFFLKTLEKIKPNGVVAFITSTYTLDKSTAKIRRMIYEKAEFIGAIRLPVNNQRAQAGTDVSSDIIFLKKRTRPLSLTEVEKEPVWLTTENIEFESSNNQKTPKSVNKYFIEHPEQIAGDLFLDKGMYGHYRVSVSESTNEQLEERLASIVSQMFENIDGQNFEKPEAGEEASDESLDNTNVTVEIDVDFPEYNNLGSMILNPDDPEHVYQIVRRGSSNTKFFAERQDRLNGKTLLRCKGLIQVKDAVNSLFAVERSADAQVRRGVKSLSVEEARQNLNKVYDAFVQKFGYLNTPVNSRLFTDDPEFGRVMALENYDAKKKEATKADIFEKSVISISQPITHVDSPKDGLLVCLDQKGKVDIPFIASLADLPEKEVTKSLQEDEYIFMDPMENDWVLASQYLSGNVKTKLKNALAAAELNKDYKKNVRALEQVQPKDLLPSQIYVRLGAPWIPTEDVTQFVVEIMNLDRWDKRDLEIKYRALDGQWVISGVSAGLKSSLSSLNDYGTRRRNFYDLLERALNQKSIAVYDTFEEDGQKKRVLNKQDTLAAQQKLELIQSKFVDFLWRDEDRAQRLLREYNDKFNNIVDPKFDGSHLTFPGMSPDMKPRGYQADAVWRGLLTGNILLGHEVGTGKTLEQIAFAMESKRLGKAHKPMIVVPNYMLEQMTRESQQLYPTAKILMTTLSDLKPENRKLFMGKVSNNNWDLIVITHSMFGKIGVDPRFEMHFIMKMISDYRMELSGVDTKDDSSRRKYGVKQIEKKIKTLEGKLKSLRKRINEQKDFGVTLDSLGVDMILIDEAHNYKNLDIPNAGSEISTGIQGSQRAWDLFLKTKWLYDKHGREFGISEATGTPVSNNVFEIYNIQRRLQPKLLEERQVNSVNSWAATFLAPQTQWEPSPSGSGFVLRTRYKMVNIPELMQMLRSVMDVVKADDVGIKRPEMETVNITASMSESQIEYMRTLDKRVIDIRNGGVDRSEDNLLKIVSEGRRLALDPRLLAQHFINAGIDLYSDEELIEDQGHQDKIDLLIENASNLYRETEKERATQLIFCDLGTPGGKKPYNVYDRIRDGLIQFGVDPEEIAYIHDFKTDKSKGVLFHSVREGDIRIMIGSTGKMGEGVNVQDRAVAIHHVDPPWRPSDIEQRDGRVKRFGNLFENIKRFIYTTEDTFDLFMWNLLKVKAETFSRIMAGDKSIREFDLAIDPTYAETAAITSNNVLLKEKLEVEQQLSNLEMLQRAFYDNRLMNKRRKTMLASFVDEKKETMENYLKIPELTEDPGVWSVDLVSRGYDENFSGDKEQMLPILAKIFKKEKVDHIAGITCGGIPMRVDRQYDNETQKNYTIWSICDQSLQPISGLKYKTTPKVQSFLAFKAKNIEDLQKDIEKKERELDVLEQESNKEFDRADEVLELKERSRQIEEKIKEQECPDNSKAESSDEQEQEPEEVMVM
jgi:N12 class adenine-specific DNA methylase